MAKRCDICGKGPVTGNIVSHSHKKSRRRWLPNLQRVRVLSEGRVTHQKVCTSCIKSGKVTKVA
jgi:large subunit ribosomal protein L28